MEIPWYKAPTSDTNKLLSFESTTIAIIEDEINTGNGLVIEGEVLAESHTGLGTCLLSIDVIVMLPIYSNYGYLLLLFGFLLFAIFSGHSPSCRKLRVVDFSSLCDWHQL